MAAIVWRSPVCRWGPRPAAKVALGATRGHGMGMVATEGTAEPEATTGQMGEMEGRVDSVVVRVTTHSTQRGTAATVGMEAMAATRQAPDQVESVARADMVRLEDHQGLPPAGEVTEEKVVQEATAFVVKVSGLVPMEDKGAMVGRVGFPRMHRAVTAATVGMVEMG